MKLRGAKGGTQVGAAVLTLSGMLFAGAASAESAVPLPPNTQTAVVAKRIIYNGLEMQAKVFQSKLAQQRVVNFYRQKWGKKVAVSRLSAGRIVGHLDGDRYVTVEVTPDGTGSKGSKGTIGVVKLPPAGARKPQLGRGLPQPFGARVVNDIRYPEDRTPARTVLMIDKLSPSQNAGYFRPRLLDKGWKDANDNHCTHAADRCVMAFSRGKSRMMFVTGRLQERSEVLMNIQNPPPAR